MISQEVDGWYRAESSRAVFAFHVNKGIVTETAPYGRRWLMGLSWAEAWEKLHASGFEVSRMRH